MSTFNIVCVVAGIAAVVFVVGRLIYQLGYWQGRIDQCFKNKNEQEP